VAAGCVAAGPGARGREQEADHHGQREAEHHLVGVPPLRREAHPHRHDARPYEQPQRNAQGGIGRGNEVERPEPEVEERECAAAARGRRRRARPGASDRTNGHGESLLPRRPERLDPGHGAALWRRFGESGRLVRRGGVRPVMATKQHTQFNIWYTLGAILLLMLFQSLWTSYRTIETLPYSALLEQLDGGNVEEVWISENQVRGRLVAPLPSGRREFVSVRVDPELAGALAKHNVTFTGTVENNLLRDVLGWVVPMALLIGFWYWMIRRMQARGGMGGGLLSVGKSKAK